MRRQWQDSELDLARSQTDPLADGAAAELFAARALESVNRVFESLHFNGSPLPANTPPVLRGYLAATETLPSWANLQRLARGQELFRLFSPQISLGLVCGSLPEGYAAVNVANLLGLTRGLSHMPERRLFETTQFLLDVCAPDGFADHGRAIRSIQKVRLMHAAVRRFARRHPDFRPAWGEPVNQEDMLGTVMGFSIVPLDGLRRLGIRVHRSLEDGYLHLWCVVGAMLGVREDLLPVTPAEARWLMDQGRRRHFGPSASGHHLTEGIVRYIARLLPWPSDRDTAIELIRFFVGPTVAEHLGLRATRARSAALRLLRGASRAHGWIADLGAPGRRVAARLSRATLRVSDELSRDPNMRFLMPPVERRHWTLDARRRRSERRALRTPWPVTVTASGRCEPGQLREVCEQGLLLEVNTSRLREGARITVEVAREGLRACVLEANVRQVRSVGAGSMLGCELAQAPAALWREYLGAAE